MKKSKKKNTNFATNYGSRIKRLRKIIRILVGAVIGIYLLLVALLHIPAVQKGVASLISNSLKDILHTEVTVGRVDLGYFNRVILDDIQVKDKDGGQLLHAARLAAKMELAPLLHGRISISNIQFYGFDLRLYQRTKEEKPNFQFLIDAFAKKDSTPPSHPNLRINSILVRRGRVSWHRQFQPSTPGRFNPDHIVLDKISATVSLKHYTSDSLNLNIKKISFEEQSGLQLRQLSFKFTANGLKATLENFQTELPHSRLAFAPVVLSYRRTVDSLGRTHYQDLKFRGSLREGVLTAKDFAPLYPPLSQGVLKNLRPLHWEASFSGDLKHLLLNRFALHADDYSFWLDAPLTISQLQNKKFRTITARIAELGVSPQGIGLLAEWSKGKSKKMDAYLKSVGSLRAYGTVSYGNETLKSQLELHTDLGSLSVSGEYSNHDRIAAEASTEGFNLGRLTGREEQLGQVAFQLTGGGRLRQGAHPSLSFQGTINQLQYKGYDYQGIEVDADYKNGGFNGTLSIDDPHVALSAEGQFNIQCPTPYIKGRTTILHFNPHALGLTSRYDGTTFQGGLHADFHGNDMENMEGIIRLDSFRMAMPEETYALAPVVFEATHASGHRTISLNSDFLQARMEGDFRLATLVAHCRQLLHGYIPSFVKEPRIRKDLHDEVTLLMDIQSAEPIEKILGIPLQIPQPGHVSGYFNSHTGDIDFNAAIPALNYNGQQLDDILVLAGRVNDSIVCTADFKKVIGQSPVDFRLLARAAHDHVHTGMWWTNHGEKAYKGSIAADTRFTRDERQKMLTDIEFLPTSITINDSVWNVHASDIHIAPGHVEVNDFTIEQDERHLILNGKVSAEPTDSLIADLKGINLEYVFNIVNFHTVDFGGLATGRAYATRLMKQPEVDARLHVQNFTFNSAYLGEMNLHGGWSKEKSAITLNALITDPANRSMTRVGGDIRIGAPPKGGIDLTINTENIDLGFLNRYTEGIFTGLNGRASGWTRVFGPFKGINLEGDMLVHEGGMKVNSTEVEYHLVNDSVILRPDNIYFRNAMVYDRQGAPGSDGHYAVVNGVMRHTHLSNMSYEFTIDARNILGYDVREFGDEVFCGTAYATGRVGFSGRAGQLNVNIDARPESGTEFTYNLASPTTLDDNLFITYKAPQDSTGQTAASRPAVPEEPEIDMLINFRLDLTPDATMKILMDPKAGDNITLNGHGNIRATYYNKGDFTIYGTYTIDRGLYKLSLQDVIRKDFVFNPGGTIIFSGPPTEADLNLQAVYTVPSVSLNDLSARSTFSQNNVRVNCLMNLGGKALAPQISFDFDIPNVNEDEKQMVRSLISTEEEKNMQVIYLLGIGRFYTYDYNNTEQSQSSVAMKSLLSSTLSGQLNQMFSNILGNNSNWNIGTNLSTGEVGWSDMDVEGLLSGRLLNNRLLINGNFGYRDNNATSTGNFIGDFDLQWLLTPNGNVSLKAYSKTNDRYFTKSSLTTQGIGIAVKRDFNSWRDILRNFIPRKRRQPDPGPVGNPDQTTPQK